jgi:hypothetical protein
MSLETKLQVIKHFFTSTAKCSCEMPEAVEFLERLRRVAKEKVYIEGAREEWELEFNRQLAVLNGLLNPKT